MTDFEKYKLVFKFLYPDEELKMWINAYNYNNNIAEDYDSLFKIINNIENLKYTVILDHFTCTIIGPNYEYSFVSNFNRKHAIYESILHFIQWYNK